MSERKPAEVFPPGDFIKEELEARGWTQAEFAEILGRAQRDVSEIITGKRSITPETARGLANAFGTDAQFWMNLDSAYRLSRLDQVDDKVARRARLYAVAPVKDLLRRGWIENSPSLEVLESRVLRFFEIESFEEEPKWAHAARKSTAYDTVSPALMAWLARCRHVSQGAPVKATWSPRLLKTAMKALSALRADVEGIRQVPRLLADAGVRMVVVEPIGDTRVDGACLWFDEQSPVVALSMRYDRVDAFWFTLFHELSHVAHRDGLAVDVDLLTAQPGESQDLPAEEVRANTEAADLTVPQAPLRDFVARVHPLYSRARIAAFASRHLVHPGLVVGQLQWQGRLPYSHHRSFLVKVRNVVTDAVLTDGWGQPLPASA